MSRALIRSSVMLGLAVVLVGAAPAAEQPSDRRQVIILLTAGTSGRLVNHSASAQEVRTACALALPAFAFRSTSANVSEHAGHSHAAPSPAANSSSALRQPTRWDRSHVAHWPQCGHG